MTFCSLFFYFTNDVYLLVPYDLFIYGLFVVNDYLEYGSRVKILFNLGFMLVDTFKQKVLGN